MDSETSEFESFIDLAFKGKRFDGETLPVDAGPSLAAYQELIRTVAADIWREHNPKKKRLPKGFSERFELGLAKVKPGSKIAVLPRIDYESIQPALEGMEGYDLFRMAQDRVAGVVAAANDNRKFRPLSTESSKIFKNLRRSLREDDKLELSGKSQNRSRVFKVSITPKTLEAFTKISEQRRQTSVTGLGIVLQVSQAPPFVRLATPHGQIHYSMAIGDLRQMAPQIGQVLSYSVFAELDAVDDVRRILEHRGINPPLKSDSHEALCVRIDKFADGENTGFDRENVFFAKDISRILVEHYDNVVVFPNEDGAIQFEWTFDDISAELEVFSKKYVLGASDLQSEAFQEQPYFSLSSALLRDLLNIRDFTKGTA